MEKRQSAKPNLYRNVLWAAVIMWMIWIFSLSAQTGLESDSLSGQTIHTGTELVMPELKELPPHQQDDLVANWQHTARKSAHVILFCGLGVLCLLAARQHSWPMQKRIAIALGISFGYAVFDEVHQLFVAGRTFMVTDIAIDTAAASLGVLMAALVANRLSIKPYDNTTNNPVA